MSGGSRIRDSGGRDAISLNRDKAEEIASAPTGGDSECGKRQH